MRGDRRMNGKPGSGLTRNPMLARRLSTNGTARKASSSKFVPTMGITTFSARTQRRGMESGAWFHFVRTKKTSTERLGLSKTGPFAGSKS